MILGLICHLIAFAYTIMTTACRKGHPFPSFSIGGLFVAAGTKVILIHSFVSLSYCSFFATDMPNSNKYPDCHSLLHVSLTFGSSNLP